MRPEIRYTILILLFLITSCSKVQEKKSIAKIDTGEIEKIKMSNKGVLNPESLSILDSLIVIYDQGADSNFLKIFSDDFQFLSSFGEVGVGPDEYSRNLAIPNSISDNKEVSIYDWSRKIVNRFSSTSNSGIRKIQDYTMPPELILAQRAAFLDDSNVVASGGIHKGSIALVDAKNDEVEFINIHPDFDLDLERNELVQLFYSEFTINYQEQKIAVAMRFTPEILILDFEGEILKRTKLLDYNINDIAKTPEEERIIYFHDIGSSPEFIYAVNVSANTHDLAEFLDDEEGYNSERAFSTIQVFDWDGNFVKEMELDGGFHPFITVDHKNNRIFSIDRFATVESGVTVFSSPEIR